MLKKANIKRKLTLSCIAIVLLASVSGLVSSVLIGGIHTQYENALRNYGFAQGDIGKAMAIFCEMDGAIHDAISYFNLPDARAAQNTLEENKALFTECLSLVEPTLSSAEQSTLAAVRQDWDSYQALAGEIMQQAASSSSTFTIQRAQRRMVVELDPLYDAIYANLTALLDAKVMSGEALAQRAGLFSAFAQVLAIALILLSVVLAFLLSNRLSKAIAAPIQACSARLALLAQGNLAAPVPVWDSRDEVGELAASTKIIVDALTGIVHDLDSVLGEMANGNFTVHSQNESLYRADFAPVLQSMRTIKHRLRDALAQVRQSADQVDTGAGQMSHSAQALAQGSAEQASAIEQLSARVNEIAASARANTGSAERSRQSTEAAGGQLMKCDAFMQRLVQAMDEISASSDQIARIILTIENIAFQTNILALNAAVEAARAGTAGKGFAVVADEVRNLASKSDQAAKATRELIEGSLAAVKNGSALVGEVSSALSDTNQLTGEAVKSVVEITAAIARDAQAIAQMTEGIDQISSTVHTNSATSEQSAAASEELSSQAALLRQLMAGFRFQDAGEER